MSKVFWFIFSLLIPLFFMGCEQANCTKIIQVNGHIYLINGEDGAIHDPKCPACKETSK